MPGTKKAEIEMMEYSSSTAWRGIKAADNKGMFILVFYDDNQMKSFVV